MPLRAVLYPADFLNHSSKDHNLCSFFEGSYDDDRSQYNPNYVSNIQTQSCNYINCSYWASVPEKEASNLLIEKEKQQKVWPRRRRLGGETNEGVMHHQRLTHIAVERNRRKQMNEYLSVLRSLMPHSYANKGDRASIVGGAINFVKELEHKLQLLEWQMNTKSIAGNSTVSDLFTSSRYGSMKSVHDDDWCSKLEQRRMKQVENAISPADVQVSVAECFANLRIRVTAASSGPVRKQLLLLRILEHLDECRLTVLHLNLCSAEQVALYTICMKVEDECKLASGDEIVAAVHQLIVSSIKSYRD